MTYHANTLHILYTDGEVFLCTYDNLADLLNALKRLARESTVKAVTMYYQAST